MLTVLDFFATWFWLPIPLTALHFLWCWFKAYPLYLESRIKDRSSPKAWVFLPSWWKGSLVKVAYPIMLLLCLLSVLSWTGAIAGLLPKSLFSALGAFIVSAATILWLQRLWLSQNYLLQRECYFREYKEIAFDYHSKGKTIHEADLRNRCMWEHQQSLRKAEQSGRLYRYLQAKAKSQKNIGILDDNEPHAE
jgi:Zn-dependent protease with chaperone function